MASSWLGRLAFACALVGTLLSFGCVIIVRDESLQMAQELAAAEWSCERSEVRVRNLGEERYEVRGCEQTAIYVCNDEGCMSEEEAAMARETESPASPTTNEGGGSGDESAPGMTP